jgi:uncharacterized membrane protein
MLFQR